jgi:hypothetical protein
LAVIAGFGALILAVSALIMVVWSWVIPDIFGLSAINFRQALGLFLLAQLLFNGLRFFRFHAHRNPVHAKWMRMTPDERHEFIRKRHAFFHKHSFGKSDFCEESGCPEADGASKKEK